MRFVSSCFSVLKSSRVPCFSLFRNFLASSMVAANGQLGMNFLIKVAMRLMSKLWESTSCLFDGNTSSYWSGKSWSSFPLPFNPIRCLLLSKYWYNEAGSSGNPVYLTSLFLLWSISNRLFRRWMSLARIHFTQFLLFL